MLEGKRNGYLNDPRGGKAEEGEIVPRLRVTGEKNCREKSPQIFSTRHSKPSI